MDSTTLKIYLEGLYQVNYSSLVINTVMVYDYILTFSTEIEYIWNKPWTRMSTLFVIVRYIGLCSFIISSSLGSSFIPGPVNLCGVLYVTCAWTICLYIFVVDLLMILRLWAMYNRSKIILSILLSSYLGEIILSTISNIIHSNPKVCVGM